MKAELGATMTARTPADQVVVTGQIWSAGPADSTVFLVTAEQQAFTVCERKLHKGRHRVDLCKWALHLDAA